MYFEYVKKYQNIFKINICVHVLSTKMWKSNSMYLVGIVYFLCDFGESPALDNK